MKTINVVAAVIKRENRVFTTARGYGEFKGGWEFPGGKIEPGESPEDALKREIFEELNSVIDVGALINVIEYDYPNFHLSMRCYWCNLIEGDLELKEAQESKWVDKKEIDSLNWLPADKTILSIIKQEL